MKFFNKDFFSKCDQIWSYSLKKSLMENFIFCAVNIVGNLEVIYSLFSHNASFCENFERSNRFCFHHWQFCLCSAYSLKEVAIIFRKPKG